MKCGDFVLELEEFLAAHPGAPGTMPAHLKVHAEVCGACTARWRTAARSRLLLMELRPPEPPAADPYFLNRVRARIQAQRGRPFATLAGLRVAWKDLIVAGALCAVTLGAFVYNLRRTERPNADEAIVLDVPHIDPHHPADSHRQPQTADALVSLIYP